VAVSLTEICRRDGPTLTWPCRQFHALLSRETTAGLGEALALSSAQTSAAVHWEHSPTENPTHICSSSILYYTEYGL